jgi:hypothetical protein
MAEVCVYLQRPVVAEILRRRPMAQHTGYRSQGSRLSWFDGSRCRRRKGLEHVLLSRISINCRVRPLSSREVILSAICSGRSLGLPGTARCGVKS